MMSTLGVGTGGTFGEFKKQQNFTYTSAATSIGKGERSNPNKFIPSWTPAPNHYQVARDGSQNEAPKFKIGTGKRTEDKVPPYPGPADKGINIKTQIGVGPKYTMGIKKSIDRRDNDGLGPGAYLIKAGNTAPCFTMGSRFDSDVRSKDHLRPRKSDGPGPGSYAMKSTISLSQPPENAQKKSTFGMAKRDWSDLPQNLPGPNAYYPMKFTEATHHYSFPKALKSEEQRLYKSSFTPGPGAYEIRRDDKQEGTAKSFLGGPDGKRDQDNGVPGPGHYTVKDLNPIPGFRIVPHQKRNDDLNDDGTERNEPVGPQKYNPNHPAHTTTGIKFGTGTRDDLKQKFFTPAPNNYNITSDIEKIKEKPKFHMGIKHGARQNKNLDMPGPGEYETDIIPLHHANLAHVIGTSVRSDLGVGKSHLYPGPGEYETRGKIDGPQVGFGTQMKVTTIKKTFEPGPGSYDLPTSVGHIPKYLLMASGEGQMQNSQIKSQNDD